MDEDKNNKRDKQAPIPDNLDQYLNEEQLYALEKIDQFGCKLKFVRRPVFQKTVPVLVGPDGETMGIIEENGCIVWDPNIDFRK